MGLGLGSSFKSLANKSDLYRESERSMKYYKEMGNVMDNESLSDSEKAVAIQSILDRAIKGE